MQAGEVAGRGRSGAATCTSWRQASSSYQRRCAIAPAALARIFSRSAAGTGVSSERARLSIEATIVRGAYRPLKPDAEPTDPPLMSRNSSRDRRGTRRRLRPLSCEIELDGKVHSGVIRDLSPQGLFVTVRFDSEPGARVIVRVRRPGGEIWEIEATTARQADGSAGIISRRGVGLVIEEAPIAFHEFVAELVRQRGLPAALQDVTDATD
jgi:hypothetical protein